MSYIVFGWNYYYPKGGQNDIIGIYEGFDEARYFASNVFAHGLKVEYDWMPSMMFDEIAVFDAQQGKTVLILG